MKIPSDQDLLRLADTTPSILPRSLCAHLNAIAESLALVGAVEEALEVWRLAFSESVPPLKPQTDGSDITASAVCAHLSLPDLSREQLHGQANRDHPAAELAERVARTDSWTRLSLLNEIRSTLVLGQDTPSDLTLRAYKLAQSFRGPISRAMEEETLRLLEEFVPAPGKYLWAVRDALLLHADIAFRHGEAETARRKLRAWGEMSRGKWASTNPWSLRSLSALLCSGALSELSQLGSSERREIVARVLEQARRGIERPPVDRARRAMTVGVYDESDEAGWLWLQPAEYPIAEGDRAAWAFWDAQAYYFWAHFRTHTVGTHHVEIELAEEVPGWEGALSGQADRLQVLANPFAGLAGERDGNLFVAGDFDGWDNIGDRGFHVPPGEYDVLARFWPRLEAGKDLGEWDVRLTFLPPGMMEPGALLNPAFYVPQRAYLYREGWPTYGATYWDAHQDEPPSATEDFALHRDELSDFLFREPDED